MIKPVKLAVNLSIKQVPGKEEFYETLRYFDNQLARLGVTVHLNTELTQKPSDEKFDEVVLATGINPRTLTIEGATTLK